ncbi:hypothetical protein M9Y10_002298 [Tritrichomonas musculus]|uniref:Uncharacterized protein n=1 Tax=Tritrichomonas musculus TaxID=1915356 RepID=A0ABR2LC32_9EUKA
MSGDFDLLYKVLIIGDSSVGKSCLLLQFSDQTFSDNYVSTIGVDFKIRTIDVNGRQIKLQIWDTAGQERFQSITANYYHGSHAIAIVYDITSRQSFENVRKWITEVDRLANPQVCKLLVGNKADLQDKREVSKEDGQSLADGLGIPFMETSAKTAYNVKDMFMSMCLAIQNRQGRSGFNGNAGNNGSVQGRKIAGIPVNGNGGNNGLCGC